MMKREWKNKVFVATIFAWLAASAVGYWGRNTVYKSYQIDAKKMPYFVLVLQGIHDGVYPWSGEHESLWEMWEQLAKEHNDSDIDSTEMIPELGVDGATESVTENSEMTESTENVIKEFETVTEDYFSDAVFIGDSRTEGLRDYGGLEDATFYATTGMNIYKLWTEKFCEVDGENVTLEEALGAKKYGKIYFQIGINELGTGTIDGFMEAYVQAVAKFRELQPDAIIFVQGIMKVTKEKSDGDAIYNNQAIQARNDRIAELSDMQQIFYIDMNEAVCDEEGNLDASLTYDEIHLFGSKYKPWVKFLLEHGIQ